MLSVSLWWKHFHSTGYEKYQSPPAPRKNCSRKSLSSEEKGLLRFAWLETGTSNVSCSVDEKIILPGMNFITTGLL